ncbi:hypothetical protein HYH03_016688 [Edaphochlamys debaryana]|uniref:Uncharacterized protein n=1 Tax=Edaphochlamys debaryana TaxID=47281 RepID=A0A835XKM5_9CHLO|nr:hypothetical protein HYH03_016688 [Edaphochlamys debaryana]|eukprot:KAG2484553.1 hypothetical protein HYH03_016688 [Edaphochlamys debaryana]
MRRALGWLLPGHAAAAASRGSALELLCHDAAPAWLLAARDAAVGAGSPPVLGGFRRFGSLPSSQAAAGAPPASAQSSFPLDQGLGSSTELGSSVESGFAGLGGALQGPSSSSSFLASVGPTPGGAPSIIDEAARSVSAASTSLDASPLSSSHAVTPSQPLPVWTDCPPALGGGGGGGPGEALESAIAACSAAESSPLGSLLMSSAQHVANWYELVHSTTGLPWVASIPLTTFALRLALLPISMRQARIIRTNFSLYKEALALTDEQERQQREAREALSAADDTAARMRPSASGPAGPGSPSPSPVFPSRNSGGGGGGSAAGAGSSAAGATPSASASLSTSATAGPASDQAQAQAQAQEAQAQEEQQRDLAARLARSQAVLANFNMLRAKLDVPHPVWILVNPLVQIPVFVLVSTSLGMMCRAPWPGLATEGALWFQDLTLPAVLLGPGGLTDLESAALPMGPVGLALPLLVYALTMTSLRLGVGASGMAARAGAATSLGAPGGATAKAGGVEDTALGAFLRGLPPLLYALTTLNLVFKVQMAQGVLVHWLGSAGFTLGLQMALRVPALRELLKLNRVTGTPSPPSSSSSSSSSSLTASSSASSASPSSASTSLRFAELPSDLVDRVATTSDPNILVIMGAQLSARQHYPAALHCLRKAVLLRPGHTRAHYSMGQVYALTNAWPDAEVSYKAAAEVAEEGPERGQALYCVGTALHAQGKLSEAVEAYRASDEQWPGQVVVPYAMANALVMAGRTAEAAEAVATAEERDAATPGRPFAAGLARLKAGLVRGEGKDGTGSSAGSGDGKEVGGEKAAEVVGKEKQA